MALIQDTYIYIDWNFQIIEASLTYRYWLEDEWFLAECRELQLVDQGETLAEAVNNLSNMIIATLVDAIIIGKIEDLLKDSGFKKGKLQIPN